MDQADSQPVEFDTDFNRAFNDKWLTSMSKLPYFSNGFNDSSKDKWLKPLSKLLSR